MNPHTLQVLIHKYSAENNLDLLDYNNPCNARKDETPVTCRFCKEIVPSYHLPMHAKAAHKHQLKDLYNQLNSIDFKLNQLECANNEVHDANTIDNFSYNVPLPLDKIYKG